MFPIGGSGGVVIGGGGDGGPPFESVGDSETVAEDNALTGNALDNDEAATEVIKFAISGPDPDEPAVEYMAGTSAAIAGRGTFTIAADGEYTFTPVSNYAGTVPPIRLWVTDGESVALQDLDIEVTDVNDPPVAGDGYGFSFEGEDVTIDLLSFASDPDPGATLTITHVDGDPVSIGTPIDIDGNTITYQGDGELLVEPDAETEQPFSFEFEYTVSDGTSSDTGTVTFQVGAENLPLFSPFAPILSGNALDEAAVNFGKTYRRKWGPTDGNGVNVAAPPYSAGQGYWPADAYGAPTDREPWLYDRATTVWLLAKRTGDPAILADAMMLAERYMAGVAISGSGLGTFTIIGTTGGDPTDVKYLYGPIAWWYERERNAGTAGNATATAYRTRAQALYLQTLQSFTREYNAGTAELWTERNSWASIMNCLAWYWISGSESALNDATAYVEDILTLSAGSGVPLHSKDKHEQDGDPTQIISPWMLAFLVEAMVQYHRTTDDAEVLAWIAGVGDWIHDHAVYEAVGDEEPELAGLAGLRIPAYLAGASVQYPEGEEADMQHAGDVASMLRKCVWAKTELEEDTEDLETLIAELEEAAEVDIAYWTRSTEGYPRYRVNPPRSYGWRYRNRYSNIISVGIVPFPPSNTVAPVISGSTQQGATLSCTTGTWAGSPTPTYTYQWRRSGSNISGATSATYDTVADDIGEAIDCVVTATNTGGSASQDSNNITVVEAGAPEVLIQPTAQSAEVDDTATFSVTAFGDPEPTAQWQVNDGGGWANVSGGTPAVNSLGDDEYEYTYETPTITSGDNGNQYRVVLTNTSGTATSNAATLALVVDQGSARFSSNDTGAALTFDIGDVGHSDLVIEALVYFEGKSSSASFLGLRHTGNGRYIHIGCNNTFEVYDIGIGDSQTGHTAWSTQPDLNTWYHVTIQCQALGDGDNIRATFTAAEGTAGTRYAATRANGVEDSVQGQATFLGGAAIGQPGQSAVRFQYVRARSGYLDNTTVDGHRQDVDTTGWAFWWRFYDDGGLAVEDLTGNNRVPTLTGGTFETGPVVPGVP